MVSKRLFGCFSLSCIITSLTFSSGLQASDQFNNTVAQNQPVSLAGAGATLPAPLYQLWISEFTKNNNSISIKYDAVGSGKGVESFLKQTVDFGASDAPLTAQERQKFPSQRLKPIQIPMTGGIIVFAYNLSNYEGMEKIRLSRETYCEIVNGEITNWNDPKIAANNPDLSMPDLPIVFVHRSDGSGTTFIFTNHLKSACSNWKAGASKTVKWPTGTGAKGNDGVTAQIQQTQGAIGYIEYSHALDNNLAVATLQNRSGNFIEPSPDSASLAFTNINFPDDLALVISDTKNPNAYPIVGLTWLLIYGSYDEPAKEETLKNFIKWCLTNGDQYVKQLGYLPIPEPLQQKVLETIDAL